VELVAVRYFEPREEYSYEKRGANYYGFCDKACKVIVRPHLSQLRKAMQVHNSQHHGQLSFPVPEPLPDLPPW
jgi:hypothetical protein